MLTRSIARKTVSLSSSTVGSTRSIQKSTVNRFAAGHGYDAGAHGHDDHHPHPVRSDAFDLLSWIRYFSSLFARRLKN